MCAYATIIASAEFKPGTLPDSFLILFIGLGMIGAGRWTLRHPDVIERSAQANVDLWKRSWPSREKDLASQRFGMLGIAWFLVLGGAAMAILGFVKILIRLL